MGFYAVIQLEQILRLDNQKSRNWNVVKIGIKKPAAGSNVIKFDVVVDWSTRRAAKNLHQG